VLRDVEIERLASRRALSVIGEQSGRSLVWWTWSPARGPTVALTSAEQPDYAFDDQQRAERGEPSNGKRVSVQVL
jgi:hypothetical protein